MEYLESLALCEFPLGLWSSIPMDNTGLVGINCWSRTDWYRAMGIIGRINVALLVTPDWIRPCHIFGALRCHAGRRFGIDYLFHGSCAHFARDAVVMSKW